MTEKTAGSRSKTFDVRLCMLFAIRGYTRNLKDFKLKHKVSEYGMFSDIVFDEGSENYQVFYVKHQVSTNTNVNLKITHSYLFNEKFDTNFNLLKLVRSLRELNLSGPLRNKIKGAVVFTNLDFDHNDGKMSPKLAQSTLESIQLVPVTLNDHAIFDTKCDLNPEAKYYEFSCVFNIIRVLQKQAKIILDRQNGGHPLQVNDEDFLRNFETLSEEDIRQNALETNIFAVNQPNDIEIEKLIKKEMSDVFKLKSVDPIYNTVEKRFREWYETKKPIWASANNSPSNVTQNEISFKDVDELFQRNVKKISFGIVSPISSFTGRTNELNTIREELEKKRQVVVSQAVAIHGLGGIGKTEVTRQFVKNYGISDFYGRVIWIAAESNELVKKSFIRLAHNLEINDISKKTPKVLIDEVFEYFEGLKVLFVFDNYDNFPEGKFCYFLTFSAFHIL